MQAMKFKYVSHTADMAFIAYGSTFKGALENASLALLNVMLDLKKIKKLKAVTRTRTISDKARTREDIVWFLLQDILSVVDSEKINAYKFTITELKETKGGIRAKAVLYYKDVERDFSMLSVKAVTPHGLKVNEKAGRHSISVVVDV